MKNNIYRKFLSNKFVFIFLLGLSMSIYVYPQNNYFDNDFGNLGMTKVDVFNSSVDYCNAMKIQKDGKILLVGSSAHPDQSFASQISVVRLNSDGTLDESFADNGIYSYMHNNENTFAEDVELLDDENMLIAGYTSDEHILLMLTEDGDLNEEFDDDGIAVNFSRGRCFDICIGSDGSIFLLGDDDFLKITKLKPSGILDTAFGKNGITKTKYDAHNGKNHLVVDSNTPIILGNYGGEYEHYFFVAKFDSLGFIDSSFNDDGYIDWVFEHQDYAGGLELSENGSLYVTGTAEHILDDTQISKVLMKKYNLNGNIDTNFGNEGTFVYEIERNIGIKDLLLLNDGSLLVAGGFIENDESYLILFRINANGTLDNSFGNEGIIASKKLTSIYSMGTDANNQVLAAGHTFTDTTSKDFGLVRFNSDFALNKKESVAETFKLHPNPIINDFVISGNPIPTGFISLKLYDLHGKEIYSFNQIHKYNSGSTSVNFRLPSFINKGIYFLRFETPTEIHTIKAFVQ